jgi:hypothetical protein
MERLDEKVPGSNRATCGVQPQSMRRDLHVRPANFIVSLDNMCCTCTRGSMTTVNYVPSSTEEFFGRSGVTMFIEWSESTLRSTSVLDQ